MAMGLELVRLVVGPGPSASGWHAAWRKFRGYALSGNLTRLVRT